MSMCQVRTPCLLGVELLRPLTVGEDVVPVIHAHHEHWDGSGYHGAQGDSIPLFSRIICLADVWDALTNQRAYRAAMSFEAALAEMNKSQLWFDPKIYPIFLEVLREQQRDR